MSNDIITWLLEFGSKIFSTFTYIFGWLQSNGKALPVDGLFEPWQWVSYLDMMVNFGLVVILYAIITKWIIDFLS